MIDFDDLLRDNRHAAQTLRTVDRQLLEARRSRGKPSAYRRPRATRKPGPYARLRNVVRGQAMRVARQVVCETCRQFEGERRGRRRCAVFGVVPEAVQAGGDCAEYQAVPRTTTGRVRPKSPAPR